MIFSSGFALPSSWYSFLNSSLFTPSQGCFGLYMKKSSSHAAMKTSTVIQIAKISQSANDISGMAGKMIFAIRANDRLGGVPTSVAIPPMDAE